MNDRLETRNGESVTIDSMLAVLEGTPSQGEVVEALKGLRRDKVKHALGETVKAAKFDLAKVFDEFLADGGKAARTVETYKHEVGRLFRWIELEGLHVLQVRRADVNRFKSYLAERYSQNTCRLALSASSAFYGYLEAERYVDRSAFVHIKYPKKQYRKSIKPSQGAPEPVMNEKDYLSIVTALGARMQSKGILACEKASRESARRLLPMVHFMAVYGLRIGDVLTVKIESDERFSYRQKGSQVRQKLLRAITREVLAESKMQAARPFKGIAKSTVQGAVSRLTRELAGRGVIRHGYSCHDFRHYYAIKLYGETKDIYAVKEALGHSSVSTTEVYLAGLGALKG